MNRLEVEILGKKWNIKAPHKPEEVTEAIREVKERCEMVQAATEINICREDIFLLVSLNLAKELAALKRSEPVGLFSTENLADESR